MRENVECVLGCPRDEKFTLHGFPMNPTRRAEWCRILGVNPKQKRVCICSAHFKDYYIFGKRLSCHAIPDPPYPDQLKYLKKRLKKYKYFTTINKNKSEDINPINEEQTDDEDVQSQTNIKIQIPNQVDNQHVIQTDTSISVCIPNIQLTTEENQILQPLNGFQTTAQQADTLTSNVSIPPQIYEDITDINNFKDDGNGFTSSIYKSNCSLEEKPLFSLQDNNDEAMAKEAEEDNIKTGDFEIRKRDTKELIVQIRSVKTNNSRVLSFVLPEKHALQQLIRRRDRECNRKYKEIENLEIDNGRLLEQLKIYRLAMSQWRYVRTINRYLNFKLKKYRQIVTKLKKKLKRIKRINKLWNEFKVLN